MLCAVDFYLKIHLPKHPTHFKIVEHTVKNPDDCKKRLKEQENLKQKVNSSELSIGGETLQIKSYGVGEIKRLELK